MANAVRYLVVGDIHLGHKRNPTNEIVANLNEFFEHYQRKNDLDILFIAGDVFDRLLDMTSVDIPEIMVWISRVVSYCGRFKIKLRVLEGTPSHDWMQSELFETIVKLHDSRVDFKYVTALSVEKMEDLNLSVLYVPDEWNPSTETTFQQVQNLLKENGLVQVDIAIMHGCFSYQLPAQAVNIPKHSEANYLSAVKHYIHIGHVHTFSTYERIIAQGSIDRLTHGEEEPKGGVIASIRTPDGDYYDFIENKQAKTFKTVILKKPDLDAAINQIDKATRGLRTGSFIRIKAAKAHPALIAFDEIKKKFPFFEFSKLSFEDEAISSAEARETDLLNSSDIYVPVTITEENIKLLLKAEVETRHQFTDRQWQTFDRIMEEFIHGTI